MNIHAIDHAQLSFPVDKHARVCHFYANLLGLPEYGWGDGKTLRFHAGAQRLDLAPVQAWQPPAVVPHLALKVKNLVGLRAKLLDAGFELNESRPLAGHLRFYVHDPAGNVLEFLETIPSRVSTA